MKFSEALIRGSIGRVVLSLLNDRAMYGYEILKAVNDRTHGTLDWTEAALYPSLHKLEASGFVRGEWRTLQTPRGGERRRKYYALTPSGKRHLRELVEEWREFCFAVNSLLPLPSAKSRVSKSPTPSVR